MRSIRFGLVATLICGIAALAAGVQVMLWEREMRALSDQQATISDEILELRNLINALVNMETGQRGYLLTGDDAYLKPYEIGRRNFASAAKRLDDFFRDDPPTLGRIAEFTKTADAKQAELARTIALRQGGDTAGALAIVKTGTGEHLMDAFRDKATALLLQLRNRRTALAVAEERKFDQASILAGAVVSLIIVLVAIAILWLSLSLRRVDELQMRREQEAMHDSLTTLPNRRYFTEWLTAAVAAACRSGRSMILLYVDLDGFKGINDRHGHEAGDRVLQVTAARLRRVLRSSDFVARLGGDEFVAALPEAPSATELTALIARLADELAKPQLPELAAGEVSASIGAARYPDDGADLEALLGAADRAMYSVKEARKARRRSAAVHVAPAEAADG